MPGSNARALDKARSLDVDALILDLEDAVAPHAKETGREQIREALAQGGYGHREVVIRINGLRRPGARPISTWPSLPGRMRSCCPRCPPRPIWSASRTS